MDKPTAAILLTFGVHVVGIVALFWLAFDDARFDWRSWWPGEDEDKGGGGDPPAGCPPLPDAGPAGRRLRTGHERLAGDRRPTRRPAHATDPGRTREPV